MDFSRENSGENGCFTEYKCFFEYCFTSKVDKCCSIDLPALYNTAYTARMPHSSMPPAG